MRLDYTKALLTKDAKLGMAANANIQICNAILVLTKTFAAKLSCRNAHEKFGPVSNFLRDIIWCLEII